MCSAGEVEERGLAAVGIADECHVDGSALAQGLVAQVVVRMVAGVERHGRISRLLLPRLLRHHFNQLGLLAAQAHLVAHQLVLHGIVQRGVEQHLHEFSPHEAHLNDALAEATVPVNLHDDTMLTSLQFR